MSEQDDALRAMAANRGCKLVKSRRRKPGGDFGRYGLKDKQSGREMFGFGARGLTATADEIRAYLRSGEAASWKRSMIAPVPDSPAPRRGRRKAEPERPAPRRRKAERQPAARPAPAPARPPRAKKRAEPAPPRPPEIREARPADAGVIAKLLDQLGYDVSAADVKRRLAALRKSGEPALVAARGREVIGCASWHVTPVIHRPRPVGRITMMVVAEDERGAGIGTMLVAAVEERLRHAGCGLAEVTSNIKRMRAHDFYRGLGFERTSYRFARTLEE